MQLSELPVVGTGSVQPDWSGGGTGPAGSEASPPVGRVLRWGVPGLRIRRRKPRWPPTRGASSTVLWSWATASTRSTTSASTGRTTSSSTRTSRSSAPS